MFRLKQLMWISTLGLLLTGCNKSSQPLKNPDATWISFVQEITNMTSVASLSTRGTHLISSYDRTGGNNDFNYFVGPGSEAGWKTMVDIKGPGCVRRWWFTGFDQGHPIKVYFDDEKTPRISGKVEELLGYTPPFLPPLAQYLNLAWHSYIPLTFNKSLRIETPTPPNHPLYGPRKFFFQLNVESLDPSKTVETFPKILSAQDQTILDQVQSHLLSRVNQTRIILENGASFSCPPNQSATIFDDVKPGQLNTWSIRINPANKELAGLAKDNVLNQLILQVYYNASTEPSISLPLSDFFLCPWRQRHFGSLPLTSGPDGFTCRLPMPYHQGVRLELQNLSGEAVEGLFAAQKSTHLAADAGYLHAVWSKTGPQRGTPHLVAAFEGEGKFIGCSLGVTGHGDSWWILEGDETIRVDGELRPSWSGTGLEDYFNGGWYYRGSAFAPFHGIFDRAGFRTAQYRLQTIDPVMFKKSLSMSFERGDQNVSDGYFRSVAYAYLKTPTPPSLPLPTAESALAEDNPLENKNLMIQLIELERMNNFHSAMVLTEDAMQATTDAELKGILNLRILEYKRLLGQQTEAKDYQPYIEGKYGAAASQQAKLLKWFYSKPNRALVGLYANGQAQVYFDGKAFMKGDHPLAMFVQGVEINEGPHLLSCAVRWSRPSAWLQLGVRTHAGVTGSGPGIRGTRNAAGNWHAMNYDDQSWAPVILPRVPRGVPDAPIMGAVPNAFVLLQSKVYPMRAADWDHYRDTACFRIPFNLPLQGFPEFAPLLTGLSD